MPSARASAAMLKALLAVYYMIIPGVVARHSSGRRLKQHLGWKQWQPTDLDTEPSDPLQSAAVNKWAPHIVQAFDEVFPGKWYLEGGTMISALRYGNHIHTLASGRVDIADTDFDVTVLQRAEDYDINLKKLLKALPKDFADRGRRSWGSQEIHFPGSHIHMRSVFEEADGGLRPDPLQGWNWFPVSSLLGLSFRDLIFPLKRAIIGGGVDAWVPNHYLFYLAQEDGPEYGAGDRWKTMWMNEAQDGCTGGDCEWTSDDEQEIKGKILALDFAQKASFKGLLPQNQASNNDVALLLLYRRRVILISWFLGVAAVLVVIGSAVVLYQRFFPGGGLKLSNPANVPF